MASAGRVHVGTSGYVYPHWRSLFYPPGLRQDAWYAHYCRYFDTVEINNTFYRLPAAGVFDAWKRQAPPGFVYAVKASRYLTHQKKLKDPREPLENVLGRTRRLAQHLGPVLYQLPPRWHCNVERLREFIGFLPAGFRHVFEFRDPTWHVDAVRELLTEHGMSFCIHDFPGVNCPAWVTGPLVYLRFHGPTAVAYAGSYRNEQLRSWAERIEEFRQQGFDVYAYFNNDGHAHAVMNAQELMKMLGVAPAVATPASPRGHAAGTRR